MLHLCYSVLKFVPQALGSQGLTFFGADTDAYQWLLGVGGPGNVHVPSIIASLGSYILTA